MKTKIALLTIALGLWLIALSLTFGSQPAQMLWSDVLSGFLLIVFGVLSLSKKHVWSGWAIGLVGAWLQLAPVIFWAKHSSSYINDTLVGAIAIAFCFLITQKKDDSCGVEKPKGWSYNPSSWSHRIPTVGLAILCWFFSRYMAAFQLGYIDHVWDPFFTNGTLNVITSKISKDFPVSDAGMGAICYTIEALLGWQGDNKRWYKMPWLVCVFGFLVIPVGIISITLIILQPVAVGAWCSWCLATAACMLLMILLTAGELAAVLQFLKESKTRGDSVWKIFWMGGSPTAERTAVSSGSGTGVSFSWTLFGSFLLGIWLMASPAILKITGSAATLSYILGPMVAALSVISMAEVFRSLRFINIFLGSLLFILPWFTSTTDVLNHIVVGVLVVVLSIPKGRIQEKYGAWSTLIK